jgi:predicted transcriptional regulator of viral defense system
VSEHRSLAEACKRVPKGVICLLSALRFHELTTQTPYEIWLAIGEKS